MRDTPCSGSGYILVVMAATLEPVMAGMLSFVIIGEVLEPVQIVGAGLVIVSKVFLQRSRREERR
jgi:drug/metabolite transporter (DMT)-like permease